MSNGEDMVGKQNEDDEVTLVVKPSTGMVPPPLKVEMSEVLICYNLGDPLLLEQAIKSANYNYDKVKDATEELKESLDLLMLEKYDSFNVPPTNLVEMKNLLQKIVTENMQSLKEFNELNKKRNLLLEKLNRCNPIELDVQAILEIYPKIKDDEQYSFVSDRIKMFLSDVSVLVSYNSLFDIESKNLVYKSIKEYNRTDESIQYLNKIISEFEHKKITDSEEYFVAKNILSEISPLLIKTNSHEQKVREVLLSIRKNQDLDFSTIDFEEIEKYKILHSYVNLKNDFISCLHDSSNEKNMEEITLKITENALNNKKTTYSNVLKMFKEEGIPFVSVDKLKKNKKKIKNNLEKLNDACYSHAKQFDKENSWKTKVKILIASATLFSLGVLGYVNNVHVNVPEYAGQKAQVTKQLYEDKKDAIKKMEKEVLSSISSRKHTINSIKDKTFQKAIDTKNKLKDNSKKMIDKIKN